MAFIFALFFGFIIVSDLPKIQKKEKKNSKIQVNTNQDVAKKSEILKVQVESKKMSPVKKKN